MVYDPSDSSADGRRGPVGGSASLWIWLAVGLGVLALLVIGPSLGTGPDSTPDNDPADDPAGEVEEPVDDGPQTVIA